MLQVYLSMVDTEDRKSKVEKIYLNYRSYMLYVANQFVAHDCAEDVVHDAMVSIIKNIDNVDVSNDIKIRTFCGTVVRNKAKDYIKKVKHAVDMENIKYGSNDDSNEDDFDLEETVITYEAYYKVLNTILHLDIKYREVCYLKYVNGMSEKEIGEMLNISPKTVNSRVKTGKQIIKRALKEE